MGVSCNKADILTLAQISKIGQCNSTSYLVSHIIIQELLSFKRILNKNHFSPDARVVRFSHFDNSQACKTPVLGEITNIWLST